MGDGEDWIRAQRAAAALRPLTAQEFEADELPAALVEGLIYEHSSHLLTGASKSGKSFLAYQLLLAIATGTKFLGLTVQQAPVLLVCLEMTAAVIRERMKKLAQAVGLDLPKLGEGLHLVAPTRGHAPELDLTTPAGFEMLAGLARGTGARLVALDTLYRFLPGLDPSENGAMGTVFGRLNGFAVEVAATLALDHVRKGILDGPVSQSALGAGVKGGASNVIAQLKRTSRNSGGRWELDLESHYGSWDEPIYYQRPLLDDGTYGAGCVRCSATEARTLTAAMVRDLFRRNGCRFDSQRKLIEALEAAGLASGNAQGREVADAIVADYGPPHGPIMLGSGPRTATTYTWSEHAPDPRERDAW